MTLCYLCSAKLDDRRRGKTPPVCAACAALHLGHVVVAEGPAPVPEVAAVENGSAAATAPAAPAEGGPRTYRTFLNARTPLLEALHQALGGALAAGLSPRHLLLSRPTFERAAGTTTVIAGHLVELHAASWSATDEVLVCEAATPEEILQLGGVAAPAAA